jgi:hypothetical protein
MKTTFALLAAALVASAALAVEIGKPAPDFSRHRHQRQNGQAQ